MQKPQQLVEKLVRLSTNAHSEYSISVPSAQLIFDFTTSYIDCSTHSASGNIGQLLPGSGR